MKPVVCEHEEAVLRVAGREEPGTELEAHAAGCETCRETLRVAGGLRRAAAEEPPPRLPTAAQLWWRARIVRRLSGGDPRKERATRPLAWGFGIGGLTALVGLAVTFTLAVSRVRTVLSGVSPEPALGWLPFGLVAVGTPIVAFAVLFLWIWREA
jgi:hypothetical protein